MAVKITNNYSFLLTWNFGCWNTLKTMTTTQHKKAEKSAENSGAKTPAWGHINNEIEIIRF